MSEENTWPSYEDVASGMAPMPDIPGVSLNPLIIPPCPPAAREVNVDVQVITGNTQVKEHADTQAMEKKFKDYRAQPWKDMIPVINEGLR